MGNEQSDPGTLVTIAIAARRCGYRRLEREARRRLQIEHGVRVTIPKSKTAKSGGVKP